MNSGVQFTIYKIFADCLFIGVLTGSLNRITLIRITCNGWCNATNLIWISLSPIPSLLLADFLNQLLVLL